MTSLLGVRILSDWQLFPQSLMLDGQAPMEAQYAEESPGPWIFRAELGDPLRRPEAQQQPSRADWAIGNDRVGAVKG